MSLANEHHCKTHTKPSPPVPTITFEKYVIENKQIKEWSKAKLALDFVNFIKSNCLYRSLHVVASILNYDAFAIV